MITARQLTGADAETWQELRLEGLNCFPLAFLTSVEEAAAHPIKDIAKQLERGQTFGVFDGGAAVGIGSLIHLNRLRTRHRGEIGAFYVRPSAQGTGAADKLMNVLSEKAQKIGVWQLELFVAESNPRAIRFYQRHGFRQEGRLPNAIIGERGLEHDIFCVRQLESP